MCARNLWAGQDAEAIFDDVRYQDYLLHHPFESFASVESFLRAAVKDPHVIGIKMTLYRIGENSPLIDLLIEAAEAGKQVAVLVELKARFDERNNIIWANRLEEAGVHVVYGLVNLKTHCKLCLVVRQEADGIRRYAHIGTGNYNPATSKVYTDLGLFTADHGILDDVSEVFNYLTGYSNRKCVQRAAGGAGEPRTGLRALIEREIAHAKAGTAAHLIFKNNAMTDPGMIRSLYLASQAGVPIDLITRGVCSLRPGIPGVSETISVTSIVGRFLEHSRIYYFENGGAPEVFIGSADLMERNLDRRVEVLCPVRDADISSPSAPRRAGRGASRYRPRLPPHRRWRIRAVPPDRGRGADELAALPARALCAGRSLGAGTTKASIPEPRGPEGPRHMRLAGRSFRLPRDPDEPVPAQHPSRDSAPP